MKLRRRIILHSTCHNLGVAEADVEQLERRRVVEGVGRETMEVGSGGGSL